ncbi:MAG: LysM peptidoglycan-binding domain-containing protein [Planctomycetes bacterium]|nr:LysM peptidoglycan-binding domain-containing protein [Planctomycetota bacterium]
MQRIERYGVIALVLLLVTIAAVSFWEQDGVKAAKPEDQLAQAPKERVTPRDADRALPATTRPTDDSRERQHNNAQQSQNRRYQAASQRNQAARDLEMQQAAAQARAAQQQPAPTTPPPAAQPQDLGFPDALTEAAGERPAPSQPKSAPSRELDADAGLERDTRGMHVLESHAKPERAGAPRTYTVKAGETLGEIAYAQLGSSKRWPELAALNGGKETIYEGQVLTLPGAEAAAAPTPVAAAPKSAAPATTAAQAAPSKSGAGSYTVRKGDMLSVIAQTRLGSAKRWREIAALNPKVDPDRLLEGTVLVLPTDAKPTAALVASRTNAPARDAGRRVR